MNKKVLVYIISLSLILIIFFVRLFSHAEIDDISPEITCNPVYVEKSDVLWVIPEFDNQKITENQSWCKEILSLNKTLGLHGINHEYKEFDKEISIEKLEEGIAEFQKCFNQTPNIFKAPQLAMSKENEELLKQYNLTIKGKTNQFTHKVYHCEDESKSSKGLFPNWVIDLF